MTKHDEIRQKLESKLVQLQQRSQDLLRDKERGGIALDPDSEEQVTAIENDEVIDALDEKALAEIILIQAALQKMDSGKYGTCQNCDEVIDIKRLLALPHTPYCIECA